MRLNNSQIIPVAFWVGFLALGLATSFAGGSKHGGGPTHVAKSSVQKLQSPAPKALIQEAASEAPAPKID